MSDNNKNIGVTGKYTLDGRPKNFTTITPFIVVKNPLKAIEFYKNLFNAKVKDITDFLDENGNKIIVHAVLDFGNGYLQLGAANPSYKLVLQAEDDNTCFSLAIYVADVDKVIEKAIKNGAILREPVNNFVSGDRFGSILDPYGVRWTVMTRIEDISEEESYKRVGEWAKSFNKE